MDEQRFVKFGGFIINKGGIVFVQRNPGENSITIKVKDENGPKAFTMNYDGDWECNNELKNYQSF